MNIAYVDEGEIIVAVSDDLHAHCFDDGRIIAIDQNTGEDVELSDELIEQVKEFIA